MDGESPTENNVDDLYFSALSDDEEVFPISDGKYADGLQFQEVLLSSLSNQSQLRVIPPIARKLSVLSAKPLKKMFHTGEYSSAVSLEKSIHTGESSSSSSSGHQTHHTCAICYEAYTPDVIFHNKNCHHVFCKDCISHHIGAMLQDNISSITCPDPGCHSKIVLDDCVDVVPPAVFDRWSSALCESLVLASQRFYCPFKDCSMLLIDDGEEEVTQAVCPWCQRLFCAQCKVAWHAGLACGEYQSLDVDERAREDLLLIDLAKTKNWKRCPKCKFYVERGEGCLHMTCRCAFQFCYGCGGVWSEKHESCHT